MESAHIIPNAHGIPIAGFKDVYDICDVERALDELPPSANEALKSTYEKMIKAGGARFTVKPSGIPAMESLYEELPNFRCVLDDIKKHIALCADSRDCMELPPLLLLGEPGIGKTHFGKRLAQLLSTGFGFISMSSMTAGWILSGSSSQWKNAKPGKVFETMLNGDYANPVMVVDEIDKAGGDAQHDPLGALYSLLEQDTAAEFIDEFVEIPINASSVVWIATANDASRIPDPILNRVNVYEISPPDHDGARRIAQALYSEIRNGHDWGRQFPEAPSDQALESLSQFSPREMRRVIVNGFGNAKLDGRDEMLATDVAENRAPKKQRIGF